MLPEKWCVKRTEDNYSVLNEWNNSIYGEGSACNRDIAYMYSDKTYQCGSNYYKDYTEITYDDFLKYVIKKEPEESIPLIFN